MNRPAWNADRLYPLERSKRLVILHILLFLFNRNVDDTISTACVRAIRVRQRNGAGELGKASTSALDGGPGHQLTAGGHQPASAWTLSPSPQTRSPILAPPTRRGYDVRASHVLTLATKRSACRRRLFGVRWRGQLRRTSGGEASCAVGRASDGMGGGSVLWGRKLLKGLLQGLDHRWS
jgi:hypothetical protein